MNVPYPRYSATWPPVAESTRAATAASSVNWLLRLVCTTDTYAASSASAVSAAEPIAKPLPVAAVVLPSESSMSVRSRTNAGCPVISALPPALSAIGPYASVASVMPSVESMPTAAMPTP